MRTTHCSADAIATLLREQTIADMAELQRALGTKARRTVFRKLAGLPYRSSYSHRGRYYTLDELTDFDELGLWSFDDVWFSACGTLLSTAEAIVTTADAGYTVDELDNVLHVGTKDALRRLAAEERLHRQRLDGQLTYFAPDAGRQRQQWQVRRLSASLPGEAGPLPEAQLLSDELRAVIVLFFSMLDEQQRRWYAGLESLKVGHGGDRRMAELLGLDVSTVARGRHQLLAEDVEGERTRRVGGGRRSGEKNAASHGPHRSADGARDRRRSHGRAALDTSNHAQDRS